LAAGEASPGSRRLPLAWLAALPLARLALLP
jgi:hypothetical protein